MQQCKEISKWKFDSESWSTMVEANFDFWSPVSFHKKIKVIKLTNDVLLD